MANISVYLRVALAARWFLAPAAFAVCVTTGAVCLTGCSSTSRAGPGTQSAAAAEPSPSAGASGTVLKVTSLLASGPGSLAQALAHAGPRVIVFEVGGVIDLNKARLEINEPFVTVAGQTAPAPGITLIRGGLRVRTHDVLLQHLRFRMGDAGAAPASGFEPDVSTSGGEAYDVVFDHCSVAWGVDENLSVSGPRLDGAEATSRRVTIRNSIIAEGLLNSVHEKGSHSMGTLVHDYCTDISVVGNLYAHNNERNPWFKGFASGAIVNNVVYNPGKWAMRLGPVDKEWKATGIVPEGPRVSVVGNYLRQGKNSVPGVAMLDTNSRGSAYLDDNIALDAAGAPIAVASPAVTQLAEKPAWPRGLEARPAAAVLEWVLEHAGARPNERDAVDRRIVADVRAGSGAFIDSQEQVGGYPSAVPTERKLEVPSEGLTAWLESMAGVLEE